MRYFFERNNIGLYVTITLFVFIASCSDHDVNPDPGPTPSYLKSFELVYSATSSQIKLLTQFSGFSLDVNEFKYDVDIYRVMYETTFKGSDITASGLVVLPKTAQEVGMLSFQHGTITLEEDAPSNFSSSDSDALANALLYGSLSSSGLITVIPDYLGFGSSASVLHPYYVEEYTASAVIDMIQAAGELATEKDIKFNTRLFLAGYSEGGYATMAAHKAIEANNLNGFELIASFAGSGAYDISGMQEYLFEQQTYDDPYYLAYIARSYQLTYDFPTILTDFFMEPYASRIPTLFDGKKSAEQIDTQLTSVLSDLIHENLSANINTDPTYKYLVDVFEENSLTDWMPKTKMYLYHGDSDMTVPYQNSVDTYNALLANGASQETVSFMPLAGNHRTAVTPYVVDFVSKLLALR
jgi:pimeloyl-ACP methyl ester carboxylesterase